MTDDIELSPVLRRNLPPQNVWWTLFRRELTEWARRGQVLSLWWRDDDARGPSPQLDRLLALRDRYDVPLTLAVIPDDDSKKLTNRLRNLPAVTVAQHGIDHVNRAGPAEKGSRECASSWDATEIASRVAASRALLPAENVVPVFVPPWNAIHPALETALRMAGMAGWSAFGGMSKPNLTRIDTHIEPLRWKGGPRFKGEAQFLRRLRQLCRERRRTGMWKEPVGLLTHHLLHDEGSWDFLEILLSALKTSEGAKWCSLPELMMVSPSEEGQSPVTRSEPRKT